MEVKAVAKFVRVQPRKVRIVADEVRGTNAQRTADVLRFHPSKGAFALRKVIVSAIANAVENNGADAGSLTIATIMVDEGPRIKRIQARAMGRANRIVKKMSHITVVVTEGEEEAKVQQHGTKAKPRPSLSKGKGGKKAAKKKEEVMEKAPAEEIVEAPAVESDVVETPVEAAAEETTESQEDKS